MKTPGSATTAEGSPTTQSPVPVDDPALSPVRWVAPGPGSWRSLADHVPTAVTPIYAALHARSTQAGFARMFSQFGVPALTLTEAHVNGHTYIRLRPLLLADRQAPNPPRPAVWLLSRLHPAFRRRHKTAQRLLAQRPWREAFKHWQVDQAPGRRAANAALAAVDPARLDDGQLGAHVLDCAANVEAGHTLHFELHGPDLAPVGLLLVAGAGWGLGQVELLDALGGFSPASSSMARVWDQLRRAVSGADAVDAVGPVREAGPFTSLDQVRAASAEAGRLLDELLEERGWGMVTSYDLDGRALIEMPELILAGINRGTAPEPGPGQDRLEPDGLGPLRDRVPPAERARFDELIGDARASYGLRDDNGPVNVQIPTGLLRRALLQVGRRLAQRGQLDDPEHVVEMDLAEVSAVLGGAPGPGAQELTRRAQHRARMSVLAVPRSLGPPEVLPPLDALPPAMARIAAAMVAALDAMQGHAGEGPPADGRGPVGAPTDGGPTDGEPADPRSGPYPDSPVVGQGVNEAVVRGRACVARDVSDALARLAPGDILVTAFTSPAHNCLLALVEGLVVAEGGQFSHAAVMARELGLSAVVGASQAMARINDGDLIEVDPVAGVVRIIAGA
ncbi:MAG: PEP-utilizing enzyme [Acidimicrobiales bacterium]